MSHVNVGIVPLVLVPTTFLFVLLVILTVKVPKVGAWLVGGLMFAFPLVAYRAAMAGTLNWPTALPIFLVPMTFLFVLLVVLMTKAPKAGVILIVMLLMMGLLGLFVGVRHSPRPVAAISVPARPVTPLIPAAPAPIWSSGVEAEMEADVYPSEFAAARAASAKLGKAIRALAPDANTPPSVIVFQEAHPYRLIAELRDAIRRALPEVSCNIESESRPPNVDELVVTLYRQETDARPAPWTRGETAVRRGAGLIQYIPGESDAPLAASGELDINLSGRHGKVRIPVRFTQKPWLEDFAGFASARPEQAFIIARSLGTCTSEAEANQQALDDARARLAEAIGPREGPKLGPSAPPITATDVLQGGFIVDRFAQSLEGSAARIWRQALLLDVSGAKLARLADQKAREFRQARMSWARMAFSAIGVLVLIGVIYFFLNMATRGYYEWSLRIAGVVLAIVAVISILMVVH